MITLQLLEEAKPEIVGLWTATKLGHIENIEHAKIVAKQEAVSTSTYEELTVYHFADRSRAAFRILR